MMRKALISHYSGISHRLDMEQKAVHSSGGTYFIHSYELDYNPYDNGPESFDLAEPAAAAGAIKASAVKSPSGRGAQYLKRLLGRLSA